MVHQSETKANSLFETFAPEILFEILFVGKN